MFRLIVTLALLVVTGVITLAYSPAFIVWAFYLFQLWFKLLISYWEPDGTVSVKERFWTGLVQLAVTLLMLMNPTPPDDTTWSYVWMGTAFLFLCAGSHNLYTAAKVIMPRFK
jgi:hypothetical protein